MMDTRKKLAGVAVISAVLFGTSAALAEVPRTAVREVLERSGVIEQVKNDDARTQTLFEEHMGEMAKKVPSGDLSRFDGILETFVDETLVLDDLELWLAGELSEDDLKALNAFYMSSLGQRIVSAESVAATAEAWDRIYGSFDVLENRANRNSARRSLLKRLDEALRATEIEASRSVAFLVGIVNGLAQGVEMDTWGTFEDGFSRIRTHFFPEFRKDQLIAMTYIYGPITDDEIREYVEFLESSAGNRFYFTIAVLRRGYYRYGGEALSDKIAKFAREVILAPPKPTRSE